MIKQIIIGATISSFALQANAQAKTKFLPELTPFQNSQISLTNSLLQIQAHKGIAHKPTAIKQRLVAQVFSDEDVVDSMVYTYSPANGSSYNHNSILTFGYSSDFNVNFSPAYVSPGLNPSTDISADRIRGYEDGAVYSDERAYYNAAGTIDSAIRRTSVDGTIEASTYASYGALGYITAFEKSQFEEGTLGMAEARRIAYSSTGAITHDSTFINLGSGWMPNMTFYYHHNDAGQLDTLRVLSGPDGLLRVFRYDTEDRLVASDAYQVTPGSAPVKIGADTIGYTPGIPYYTFYQQKLIVGSTEIPAITQQQYPGTHAGPDSFKITSAVTMTSFEEFKAILTYNSFDNPETMTMSGSDVEAQARFYYEEYDDGLSNKDVFLNKDFAVYPNPFTNSISLDYKGTEQKNVAVSLADITGRTVFQSNTNLQPGSNNIAVPELSAGTYILQVQGKTGKLYSNKLIKK